MKRRSPVPKLLMLLLATTLAGWYAVVHPEMTLFVWAFGFCVGSFVTAVILKW